jgi:DNA-binding MarR family transcriptional regulator
MILNTYLNKEEVQEKFKSSGEISVGEVDQKASLSQATVTGILERIEKQGLITRKKCQHDRRRVLVHITEKGKMILKQAPPLLQEASVEKFKHLPEWEQFMIQSALLRLVSIMDVKIIKVEPFLTKENIEINTKC